MKPALAPALRLVEPALPNLGFPNPGEILAGKYVMERVLGVGGMAVVVAARHVALDEWVAIKLLLPKFRDNEEIVARFRREARTAAKIRSEHVGRVFDVGQLDDGTPYLVMEFLDGTDLETLVASRGSLPQEIAIDYVLQALEALAEAHGIGIIHRDLKPANLFLATRTDGSALIKLLDFGISKVSGRLTKKRSSFGTPHYMSPEQLQASESVDQRADIWSIGAILQELMTGRPPFDADELSRLQTMILKESPRPLRSDIANAPAALEAAVLRCLEKNPANRFDSVAQLAAVIAPFGSIGSEVAAWRIAQIARGASGRQSVSDAEVQPTSGHSSSGKPSTKMALVEGEGTRRTRRSVRPSRPAETPFTLGSKGEWLGLLGAIATFLLLVTFGIGHRLTSVPAESLGVQAAAETANIELVARPFEALLRAAWTSKSTTALAERAAGRPELSPKSSRPVRLPSRSP